MTKSWKSFNVLMCGHYALTLQSYKSFERCLTHNNAPILYKSGAFNYKLKKQMMLLSY